MSLLIDIQYMTYVLAAIVVILITFKLWKWNRSLNYWRDRNVSGPTPVLYFGNTLTALFKPFAYTEMEWYKKYGRIYGVYGLKRPALTVAEPELIKQIMVKEFHKFRNRMPETDPNDKFPRQMFNARDDHWKRLRLIMGPTFTSGKLRRLYPLVGECCQEFMATLDGIVSAAAADSPGRPQAVVELPALMANYSVDVVASAAFATKSHPYSHPNHPFVAKVREFNAFNRFQTLATMCLPARVTRSRVWKTLTSSGGQSPEVYFTRVVRRLMDERKKSGTKPIDFLQILMDAEEEESGLVADANAGQMGSGGDMGAGGESPSELAATEGRRFIGVSAMKLTKQEVINQCITFFIAGSASAANMLAYCAHELALNPDIQDRLAAELDAAFGHESTDNDIDYETLLKLPFLNAVLSESLRHYPAIYRLNREPAEDVVLSAGGDGPTITVEKGVLIEIPVYAIHHDPDHYPEPFTFKPDRFLPENRHQIKPYTFLPFGVGPRHCFGMRFGLLKSKLLVAKMIRRYRFYAVPDTDQPVIFNVNHVILEPRRLVVGVEKR